MLKSSMEKPCDIIKMVISVFCILLSSIDYTYFRVHKIMNFVSLLQQSFGNINFELESVKNR